MVLRSCWIKNQIVLLFCLAIVSCLSVGLFYRIVTKKKNIFERYYGAGHVSLAKKDSNCIFNVAAWTQNICRETFDNLPWFPKFPNFPDLTHCANNVSSVARNGMHIPAIQRILVSFLSLEPGFYQLRTKTCLPLKVYVDDRYQSPSRNLVLMSSGSTNNFLTVFSKSFFLDKKSHLEIVTYSPPGDNFLELDWLVPGSAHFVPILSRHLLSVVHVVQSQNPLREVLPPDKSTLVGFIPRIHVRKGFPMCSSNQIKVWRSYHSSSNITVYTESSSLDKFIDEILKLIMASLQKAAPSKYPAYKINKIEFAQNSSLNRTKAGRLLVDLNLTVDGLDYFERFGEYLYAYYHDNKLECCRPPRYQWDRSVSLSLVFLSDCSRNNSPWGLYFIENTIEILQRSLEVNFGVIISACDHEQRRRYELRLRTSDIYRNQVVMLEEVYQRSRAMKTVLSLVNGDGIVVFCESRVKMPNGISEEVRKHTFKASMAYSPIAFQLDCGYFPENKQVLGDWCPKCGGVTAMYKEDWVQILSTHDESKDIIRNKTELLDHIARTAIEIAQVKLKDLYRI